MDVIERQEHVIVGGKRVGKGEPVRVLGQHGLFTFHHTELLASGREIVEVVGPWPLGKNASCYAQFRAFDVDQLKAPSAADKRAWDKTTQERANYHSLGRPAASATKRK